MLLYLLLLEDPTVKDVNCLTVYRDEFFFYCSEDLCKTSSTLLGWADNRKIVLQCATDSLNNTLQVLNSETFLHLTICLTLAKESSLFYYFPWCSREGFMPFPKTLVQSVTQTSLLMIWIQFVDSISLWK